jgi:hypothetical protein
VGTAGTIAGVTMGVGAGAAVMSGAAALGGPADEVRSGPGAPNDMLLALGVPADKVRDGPGAPDDMLGASFGLRLGRASLAAVVGALAPFARRGAAAWRCGTSDGATCSIPTTLFLLSAAENHSPMGWGLCTA